MSIEEILEAMDIELDKSKSVPLTRGKSLIDVEQFRDLIGQKLAFQLEPPSSSNLPK